MAGQPKFGETAKIFGGPANKWSILGSRPAFKEIFNTWPAGQEMVHFGQSKSTQLH
jgi:hypothetical protein